MGLLLAGLGGAAEAVGRQAADERKMQAQKAMADYETDLAMRKTQALEEMRAKTAETNRVAKQQRMSEEAVAAEAGGKEVLEKRELETMQQRAPSVDATAKGLIDSALTPQEKEKYYGTKTPTAVSQLDAQIAAARKAGHYDTVEALKEARKVAAKDALDAQKEDRAERKMDQDRDIANQRDETMQKRIEKIGTSGGGSGGDGLSAEKLKVTQAREKRLDIQKRIDVVIKQVENRMVKKEEGLEMIRKLEAQQDGYQKIIDDGGESTEKPTKSTGNEGKSTKPPSIASVKGAPSGSFIGPMVAGKGWEIKNSSGKVIGYAKD